MKFDTVIIGGGLAGLTAGITLARKKQRVAVVSEGQSALHFMSGSLELMGYDSEGKPVMHPLEAIDKLPDSHPYKMVGKEAMDKILPTIKPFFSDMGMSMHGDHKKNHWRMSPMGAFKTAWLTMSDYVFFENPDAIPWRKVVLVNILGFLDFYPAFLSKGLNERGIETVITECTTAQLEKLRTSTTEMRATNIARVIQNNAGIDALAESINRAISKESNLDGIFFPAVVGFDDSGAAKRLRDRVSRPLEFMATMSTSVPGLRTQMQLIKHFRMHGGHYFPGDSVRGALFDGNRLNSVATVNLGIDTLEAENYIFAAGSFFSHGLTANPDGIVEPVMELDIKAPHKRKEWFNTDIFKPQPFMKYGIEVEPGTLRAYRKGKVIDNLYVAGSALSGADSLSEGSGAGVALVSAMHIANQI